MSKETEPIRSRRQLRAASAQAAGAADTPVVPVKPAPAAAPQAAPADAPQTAPAAAPRGERESQTRARDRAALRAYNELVDPPAMNPMPSRRTLRQAQLDAERAPITSVNPVISVPGAQPIAPAHQPSAAAAAPLPAVPGPKPASPAAATAAVDAPAAAPAPAAVPAAAAPAAARTRSGRRAAAVSSPASRQREQLAARNAATAASEPAPAAESAPAKDPAPAAKPSAPAKDPAPAAKPSASDAPATGSAANAVPEAELPEAGDASGPATGNYPAMPGLVPGGSYYPVSAGPPPAAPSDDELQAMAAQKAEAERAAILSQRAEARDRLVQESAKSKRQAADPTATDNLGMVTPLEFIEMPGSNRPVMRPPTTTHVPIVTRATPRQAPARPKPAATRPPTGAQTAAPASVPSPTVPSVSAERFDAALAARAVHRPGPGNRPLTGGRSSTLLKAEAMATGGHPTVIPAVERVDVQRSQMPPMPADYAHGLEPLDAMTAGLGRTQRNLLIQWGSIIVGGAALVVGAIMFITALAR